MKPFSTASAKLIAISLTSLTMSLGACSVSVPGTPTLVAKVVDGHCPTADEFAHMSRDFKLVTIHNNALAGLNCPVT